MTKALNNLKLVGNLANYDPTPEDAKRILLALDAAVDEVKVKFNARDGKSPRKFSL